MNAMRRWTFWRGVAATITLASLIVSGWFAREARRHEAEFAAWETARPIDIPVDFSTTGRYTAVFLQTCSRAHGEVVALKLPDAVLRASSPTQLLAGVSARFELLAPGGTNVMASDEATVFWEADTLDGAVPLFGIPDLVRGPYEARLTILRGVPALQGVPQRLEGRYLLCGLEAMPGVIARWFSYASLGLAALVGAILGYRLRRHPFPNRDGKGLAPPAPGARSAPVAEGNPPTQGAA